MNVSVENANFTYKGSESEYLYENDININISSGSILTILGPNGVGKTTLLKCLSGILSWSKGTTLFNGRPLQSQDNLNFLSKIGYVSTVERGVFNLTVEEYVVLGRASYIGIFNQPSVKDKHLTMEKLAQVGIVHLAHKKIRYISSGELQLVLIAKTLMSNPSLLLLDEPESHLDINNQMVILGLLKKLSNSYKITCIINTHYPNHAFFLADFVLLLGYKLPSLFDVTSKIMTANTLSMYFGLDLIHIEKVINNKKIQTIIPSSLGRDC